MIASLNGAREKAKSTAIKVEARQLFNLAMEHYAETGDFSTFSGFSWTKGDNQTGGTALTCSTRILPTALNRDRAIEICNSIASKLPTNLSGGSTNNKILIGCSGACTDRVNRFSVMVKRQDNSDTTGGWYCFGSSGAVYDGNEYNGNLPGCYQNP